MAFLEMAKAAKASRLDIYIVVRYIRDEPAPRAGPARNGRDKFDQELLRHETSADGSLNRALPSGKPLPAASLRKFLEL